MTLVSLIINILFAFFLVLGVIVGFIRGFKKSLVRTAWMVVIFIALIILSSLITRTIMNINFNLSYNGQVCGSISNYLVTALEAEVGIEGLNWLSIVDLLIAFINLFFNAIVFIILYFLVKWISLPLYWITNIFIFSKERKMKKRAKKEKTKIKIKKYRLAGALVGLFIGILSFSVVITPVVGYVNIAKSIERETANDEGSGVLTQTLGDDYNELVNQYDKSIPIKVFNAVKVDSLLNSSCP